MRVQRREQRQRQVQRQNTGVSPLRSAIKLLCFGRNDVVYGVSYNVGYGVGCDVMDGMCGKCVGAGR